MKKTTTKKQLSTMNQKLYQKTIDINNSKAKNKFHNMVINKFNTIY